jgi:integrase
MMDKRWLPIWVTGFPDRHGKRRYRFRRKGFKPYSFKHTPGTEGFRQEYQACVDGLIAERVEAGIDRVAPGSFDDLLARYYRSPDFLDPGERTREIYRGVLERWRVKYGKAMVRDLETRHVSKMMTEMLPHRTAANMLRKRLRALMNFAIREGMAKQNPVLATKPYKVEGDGFHTWTDDEIATYEARHPIGTMARLTFDLLLWTGQRSGDVRVMGPGHIAVTSTGKRVKITQEKTGTTVSLPILQPLAESIMATQSGAMVFVMNGLGRPFTRKGFGNKFKQWCVEASLPHCTAHGLRKAAARRFAEAGCSNQQIKAWTGHATDTEVARYTADADRLALSDSAGEMLVANLRKRLAKNDDNPLKKEA